MQLEAPLLMLESTLQVHFPVGTLPETMMRIKLRKARLFAELTQAELGQMIGQHHNHPPVSQQTIYRWEQSGNIPGSALGAIAAATGTPWDFWRV
jgi:transcriptional regulator with XRE-family HTH domain